MNNTKKPSPLEIQLQFAWSKIKANSVFESIQLNKIRIDSPGTWNTEPGPDFLNARIQIDDVLMIGDIEIHCQSGDWARHAHQNDPAYQNVILHVVKQFEPNVTNPQIPTILLTHIPPLNKCNFPRIPQGECAKIINQLSDTEINHILTSAGIERFNLRCEWIARKILKEGIEFTATHFLFDAAGYKNNRTPFTQLHQFWRQYEKETSLTFFEPILWCESALLPDLARNPNILPQWQQFIKNNWLQFWAIRPSDHLPLNWSRTALRPWNSPERRLAALIQILKQTEANPFKQWLFLAQNENDIAQLNQSLIKSLIIKDSEFDHFLNFSTHSNKSIAIQGKSRALEIVLNVVLPILKAHAIILRDSQLSEKITQCWLHLPPAENNHTLKNATSRCFGKKTIRLKNIFTSAATQQGLMHIYRNFCEMNQSVCQSCRMIHPDFFNS